MLKQFQIFLNQLRGIENKANQWPNLLFFTLLAGLLYYLGIFFYLPLEPRGIHFMRQTDSIAFMMGYFQFGNSFFEPRGYDLLGEGGKAASEFPIMYYIGAQLSKVFGPSMAIMRSLNLALAIAGIWSFFQILFSETRRFILAFLAAMLPFMGVVFFYYSINSLPDMSALGFSMIAWYFFYRFYRDFKKPYLYLATGAFALAALIKVTYLIHPVACFIGVFLFFPSADILGTWNRKQWLKACGVMMLFVSALALSWVYYAKSYNERYGNWYFLSNSRPIWHMSWQDIKEQFTFMRGYWGESYFHPRIWKVWGLIFVFNIYGSYRFRSFWNSLHWVILAGVIAYVLLFYRQFADHDYYFLLFYPYFALLLLAFLINIRELFPRRIHGILIIGILVFYMSIGLNQTKTLLEKRFTHNDIFAAPCLPLQGFYTTLDSLNIATDARFVILGDISINGAEYFIRRQGYSVHDTSEGQFIIMNNLRQKHRYQYALSIDSLSFGRFVEDWNMQLLYKRDGIALYQIE